MATGLSLAPLYWNQADQILSYDMLGPPVGRTAGFLVSDGSQVIGLGGPAAKTMQSMRFRLLKPYQSLADSGKIYTKP